MNTNEIAKKYGTMPVCGEEESPYPAQEYINVINGLCDDVDTLTAGYEARGKTIEAYQEDIEGMAEEIAGHQKAMADLMKSCEANLSAKDEEIERLQSALEALAEKMVYRGNSVAYIYNKKDAYAKTIDDIWAALKEAGIHPDGETSCVDIVRNLTEQIERLKGENEKKTAFCREFIWGEDNPEKYQTLHEQVHTLLAVLKEASQAMGRIEDEELLIEHVDALKQLQEAISNIDKLLPKKGGDTE